MADPQALVQATLAWETYERLGSPEGELAIAQAVVYLGTAPKSNAVYAGFKAAMRLAKETGSLAPPAHILNAPTRLMKDLGYGSGYAYDHDAEEAFSGQDYFPDGMARVGLYRPVDRGFEREVARRMAHWGELRSARRGSPPSRPAFARGGGRRERFDPDRDRGRGRLPVGPVPAAAVSGLDAGGAAEALPHRADPRRWPPGGGVGASRGGAGGAGAADAGGAGGAGPGAEAGGRQGDGAHGAASGRPGDRVEQAVRAGDAGRPGDHAPSGRDAGRAARRGRASAAAGASGWTGTRRG